MFRRKKNKVVENNKTTNTTELKSAETSRDTLEKELLIKNRYITSLEEENKRLHNIVISKDNTM